MLRFLLPALLVVAADQTVKYIVRTEMTLGESIGVIDGFFHLSYVENPGAAFGILADKRPVFLLLTIVILAVIIYLAAKMPDKHSLSFYALAIVSGGAVGNFIDRLYKGTVTDMFDFRIWPVFNIADIALVVGLLYIAYRLIFHGEEF